MNTGRVGEYATRGLNGCMGVTQDTLTPVVKVCCSALRAGTTDDVGRVHLQTSHCCVTRFESICFREDVFKGIVVHVLDTSPNDTHPKWLPLLS